MLTNLLDTGIVSKSSRIIGVAVFWMGVSSSLGIEEAYSRGREVLCKGKIGRITVHNLRVPSGYTCTLRKTLVKGTVTVEKNATLKTIGGHIKGNIRALPGHKLLLDSTTRVNGQIDTPPH